MIAGGGIERFVAHPGPGFFERVAQAGDQLRAIGVTIDAKPAHGLGRHRGQRLIPARQNVVAKGALKVEQAHGVFARGRALARAMFSSARSSDNAGILSSRSIMLARGPKRRQAFS